MNEQALDEMVAFAAEATNTVIWNIDLTSGDGEAIAGPVEELFNITGNELDPISTFFEHAVHPDDLAKVQQQYLDVMRGREEVFKIEFRTHPRNGEVRWIESQARINANQEPRSLTGISTDITDLKQHEHALKQIQERTQRLMQTTTKEETAQLAVETARDVLDAELSGCHHLGGDGHTLEPIAFMDTVHETLGEPPIYDRRDDADPASHAAWQAFENGESLVINDTREYGRLAEVTPARSGIIHTLGEYGVFIISATEPNAFNETQKVLIELLATALEAAFDRVEREQALRRQNDHLDKFASVVSHDLRNPLNMASGRLELAQQECDSDYLVDVARAHGRMETLIEDLLTLTREGERVAETNLVNLADMIDSCWQTVATADATLVADTGQRIRADPSRLNQLLENLFRNAVEHGGEDVTIEVGELEDGFYVADDGPGIPAEDRDQVFEPGYSTANDGIGLGLSIVQEVAEAHDWEIRITPSDAGGVRFKLTDVEVAAE
jgi:signal transduction histidine kinase